MRFRSSHNGEVRDTHRVILVSAYADRRSDRSGAANLTTERRLVFDVNDFDETTPGPWEWDVKRLAASMEVAGPRQRVRRQDRREIVTATVTSYRQAMRDFAAMTNLAVWYAHADLDQLKAQFDSQMKATRQNNQSART